MCGAKRFTSAPPSKSGLKEYDPCLQTKRGTELSCSSDTVAQATSAGEEIELWSDLVTGHECGELSGNNKDKTCVSGDDKSNMENSVL